MQYEYHNSDHMWHVFEGVKVLASFKTGSQCLSYIKQEQARRDRLLLVCNKFTWGFKFSRYAFWLGFHYSAHNKRLCVNVLPTVTLWMVWPGGNRP